MATFTVDPATLQELSSTLIGIHTEMQSMHGVAQGYSGLLGGSNLDWEVERFCSDWGYGIQTLEDHMKKVIDRLEEAALTYSKSENEIRAACTEKG